MNIEQIKKDITQLDEQLKSLFGDEYEVRASLRSGFCKFATVTVFGKNPANNIWQNSPAILNLICHLENVDKLAWEYLGHTTVKEYRKISGKDLATINARLVEKVKSKYKAIMDEKLISK